MKKKMLILIILIMLYPFTTAFAVEGSYATGDVVYASNNNFLLQQLDGEITLDEAESIINQRFAQYTIEDVKYLDEVKQSGANFFRYELKIRGYEPFCIQIASIGGTIITIGCSAVDIPGFVDEQTCIETVENFVHKLGFPDLTTVWTSSENGKTIMNLAPIISDVVAYPDLLKVTANCEEGKILNIETRKYLYDYYEKPEEFLIPQISFEEIEEKFDKDYKIVSHRLAIIANPEMKDRLAYEIKAMFDDKYTYYFFVDAITEEMLMVLPVVE